MRQDDHTFQKTQFIISLAKALHRYGASADRIEKALFLVSQKLEIEANYFSFPTGIFSNFKLPEDDEYTSMERLDPGKINLEKLYLTDKTVDMVLDGEITLKEGTQRLKEIISKKEIFSDLYVNIALFFLAAGVTIILKGSLTDALCAGLLGLFSGLFTSSVKTERIDTIIETLMAFVVSFVAFTLPALGVEKANPTVIILATLIYFLPGLNITTAIHEISSQNLTSGTARLTGALVILLKISFGSYIGAEVAQSIFPAQITPSITAALDPLWIIPTLLVVPLSFVVLFQARKEDAFWILLAGVASYLSSQFFALHLGSVAGAFASGVFIGSGSNLFARLLQRPSMIVLMPAIILLVPGSVGYRGLNFLFTQNTIDGINTLFHTASIGIALVAGAYFGNVLIKPKRTL